MERSARQLPQFQRPKEACRFQDLAFVPLLAALLESRVSHVVDPGRNRPGHVREQTHIAPPHAVSFVAEGQNEAPNRIVNVNARTPERRRNGRTVAKRQDGADYDIGRKGGTAAELSDDVVTLVARRDFERAHVNYDVALYQSDAEVENLSRATNLSGGVGSDQPGVFELKTDIKSV